MENNKVIKEKLLKITSYIKELSIFENISFKNFENDFVKRHSIERIIELIVECAIDINSIIISQNLNQMPKDYYQTFRQLTKLKIYNSNFAEKIAASVGLRNRLVHEYEKVDLVIVYSWIKKTLKLYKQYVIYINNFLKNNKN